MITFHLLKFFLKLSGLYHSGLRNARDIKFREHSFFFRSLPHEFDGYRILFISDIHFGMMDGLEEKMIEVLVKTSADLLILGGDYEVKGESSDTRESFEGLQRVLSAADIQDGVIAIKGNHDTKEMMDLLQNSCDEVLLNRTCKIRRGMGEITVTGIKYPSCINQYSQDLQHPDKKEFSIFLYHSPALYRQAAAHSYDLYLCGHTHGGQIHLPLVGPVVTHTGGQKDKIYGKWYEQAMQGYTTSGAGTSGVPVRFGCRGEIVRIELKKGSPI